MSEIELPGGMILRVRRRASLYAAMESLRTMLGWPYPGWIVTLGAGYCQGGYAILVYTKHIPVPTPEWVESGWRGFSVVLTAACAEAEEDFEITLKTAKSYAFYHQSVFVFLRDGKYQWGTRKPKAGTPYYRVTRSGNVKRFAH